MNFSVRASVLALMSSGLLASRAFFKSSLASSIPFFSSSEIFPSMSFRVFSVSYTRVSALLRSSIASFFFLSSAAYCSASLTFWLISSSVRFVEDVIVIACCFPVPRSLALTFTIPLASISNVTSICGTPRGAGAMPVSWN